MLSVDQYESLVRQVDRLQDEIAALVVLDVPPEDDAPHGARSCSPGSDSGRPRH